jgi:hypothetical protein
VEKDPQGASKLYSLAEHKSEQLDHVKSIERGYMQGRFGAIRSYNKANLDTEPYTRPAVHLAVTRARALDGEGGNAWPKIIGSHVYRLIEALFAVK